MSNDNRSYNGIFDSIESLTIDALKPLPIWVKHRNKVPVNPHTGEAASTVNPKTWGTFADIQKLKYRLSPSS
jgi:hypothetical protein